MKGSTVSLSHLSWNRIKTHPILSDSTCKSSASGTSMTHWLLSAIGMNCDEIFSGRLSNPLVLCEGGSLRIDDKCQHRKR